MFFLAVYNLLSTPGYITEIVQQELTTPSVNEVYILSTFKLQPKSGTSIFGLYSPKDNTKYFEFFVLGKLNRGKDVCHNQFWSVHLFSLMV